MKKMYPLKLNKDLNSFVLFYFKRDYMYNWQTYPDKSRQRNATSAKRQQIPENKDISKKLVYSQSDERQGEAGL